MSNLTKDKSNNKSFDVKSIFLTRFLHHRQELLKQGKKVASPIFRLMILYLIKRGMYASQISQVLESSRQKVAYHLKLLQKTGAVIRQTKGKPIFYVLGSGLHRKIESLKPIVKKSFIGHDSLTKKEQKELKGLLKPVVLVNTHSVKIRLDVLKGQLPLLPDTYQMKGWKRSKAIVVVDEIPITVFFNHTKTPNITIQAPPIYGSSAVHNEAKLLLLGEIIKRKYELWLIGLELSSPDLTDTDHHIDEPVISSEIDKGRFSVKGLWADSTPTPGIESKSAVSIDEYLAMPQKVELLEQKIDLLQQTIAQQTKLIERLLTKPNDVGVPSMEMYV